MVRDVLEVVLSDQVRARIERVPAGAVEGHRALEPLCRFVEGGGPVRGAQCKTSDVSQQAVLRPITLCALLAVMSFQRE